MIIDGLAGSALIQAQPSLSRPAGHHSQWGAIMLSKEVHSAAIKAQKGLEKGIQAAMPPMRKALQEMEELDKHFVKMRESVRRGLRDGVRKTSGSPV